MTAREAIAGVERAWASADALGVCPHCAARGPAHDRSRCARQVGGRPQSNGGRPAPAADDLGALVLAALRAHDAPMSGRAVIRAVPRRAADVRQALRALEADGLAHRNGDGWRVTR